MNASPEDILQSDLELARKLLEHDEGSRPSSQESRITQEQQPQKKQRLSQETTTNGSSHSPSSSTTNGSASKSTPKTNSSNGNSGLAGMVNKSPVPTKDKSPKDGSTFVLNAEHLKMAESIARRLHETEKKKAEELKMSNNHNKRPVEEINYRDIRRKVEELRNKILDEERHSHKSNQEIYALFNDLQGIAKDLNIQFDYPELVVIGMQSDGKSSFIEGLLGFQFNIVESNIGTRRPLILQMINSPEREQPRCRFRKEYPVPDTDQFEENVTPVHELVDEIIRRTNERAGPTSDKVSNVPIILRVEYKHCANLTIYDTPGFRLGGEETLKNEIQDMVMKLIQPRHRLIVCLEQSTVEWANTVSRPIARQIDPDFSRTILINTKFDNRVKELRTKESAEKYLSGENLPVGSKPFFLSMPLRRNMESGRFKDAILETFLDDYSKLLEVGFDESKFLPQLGLFKVRGHLEKILNEKYQQNLVPTLRALEEICQRTETQLNQVKSQLQQHDLELLKSKATSYVRLFAGTIDSLLAGSIAGQPDRNGQTLNEEKISSGVAEWPEFNIDFDIQNAKLRIYGGSQYSRLLNEFEYVAHSREFPKTSASEIASALGASKWSSVPISETAAANLVQMKAKHVFLPLIDIVLQRCSYIMKRLFPIAVDVLRADRDQESIGILAVYERFIHELRTSYESLIEKIETDCRARLKDDFVMFTKIVDWELLGNNNSNNSNNNNNNSSPEYNYLDATPEETKARVKEIMESKALSLSHSGRQTTMDDEGYKRVAMLAARMFAGIRFFFAKYVRNKMNAFFLDPMLQDVGGSVVNHFYKLPEQKYQDMFLEGVSELKEMAAKLEKQLRLCSQQRDKFKEVYNRMRQSTEEFYRAPTRT